MYVIQCVVLRHHYYVVPNKLAFQNTMWAGDQKLMIDLDAIIILCPYLVVKLQQNILKCSITWDNLHIILPELYTGTRKPSNFTSK